VFLFNLAKHQNREVTAFQSDAVSCFAKRHTKHI